jgi:hypothetical protein
VTSYVAAHHPDGLSWRYDKAMTPAETSALREPAPRLRSLKLALGFKGLGTAVVAANRMRHGGAFGVTLKQVEQPQPPVASPVEPVEGALASVKRLGGTFFRQVGLPPLPGQRRSPWRASSNVKNVTRVRLLLGVAGRRGGGVGA